jgi:FKBP-type peptidyl-prolyl cis-trans isomerase FklB
MKTINENQFKSVLAGIGISLLITSLTACDRGADIDNANNAGASPGYDAGYEFGIKLAQLRQQKPGIELDDALNGLHDALSDTNQYISRTEMCAMLQPAEPRPAEIELKPADNIQPPQTEVRSHSFVNYTKDNFAELNASRAGVVTLPSGVQYEVLNEGNGEPPQTGDAILISYMAYLPNGTVFDTTDDGELMYTSLDEIVIPGLKEALQLMNAGARWQVVIPPNRGYSTGNRMFGRRDLIYDIKLVSIDRAQPSQANH